MFLTLINRGNDEVGDCSFFKNPVLVAVAVIAKAFRHISDEARWETGSEKRKERRLAELEARRQNTPTSLYF